MLLSANVVLYAAPESGADRATVGAALSDTAITAQAMAKLHTGDRLHGSNVSAKTNDAVVTLSATAASSSAKEAAETLAANVSGVRMVNNQLIAASTALDLSSKARQATHRTAIAIEGTAITADLKIRGSLRSIAPRWASRRRPSNRRCGTRGCGPLRARLAVPCCGGDLCGCLEDRVELAAVFDDLPGADKSRRHHETVADAEFPALSLLVGQSYAPFEQMAKLAFRVVDAPDPACGRPYAREKLLAGIAEMIPDRQPRLAADNSRAIGSGMLRLDIAPKRYDLH
jgi:hypothetical protein